MAPIAALIATVTPRASKLLLQDLLPAHRFDVVPRTDSLVSAINQTRAIIPACYFDEDRCADGIAAMEAYTKRLVPARRLAATAPVTRW